jgi:type II secretory pathway component PulF
MIFTPGHLHRRAEFYHQLSQFSASGIGVVRALEQIRNNPPARSFREPIQQTLEELAKGASLAESLNRVGWLPLFDLALIEAGERSGKLDTSFRALAEYYNDRAKMAKQVLADMMYPLFLFHFAAFIFLIIIPFAASQFNASLIWLFARAALILSPLYLVVALIIYASQSKHGEGWRAIMEKILHVVPRLGSARRALALSRLALTLEALINAGVNIFDAWELAGTASGSPALRKAISAWRPQVLAGRTPAEVVRESGQFPEMFINFYSSGEVSGKLDESLGRLHDFYQDDGVRKLHGFAQWTPRLFYVLIMLIIGYEVFQFYVGYFNQISNVMK